MAERYSAITGSPAPLGAARVPVRPGCSAWQLPVVFGPWCLAVLVVGVKTKAHRDSNRGPLLCSLRLHALGYRVVASSRVFSPAARVVAFKAAKHHGPNNHRLMFGCRSNSAWLNGRSSGSEDRG